MKKFALIFLTLVLSLFCLSQDASAAKKRPSRTGSKTSSGTSRGIGTSVRFKPDRRGIYINFSNFDKAYSATYTLTYNANGIAQGAMGTVRPETASQQREILFGTCSKGVCRYHTNITNARLVIESKLKSGITTRKTYRLKV